MPAASSEDDRATAGRIDGKGVAIIAVSLISAGGRGILAGAAAPPVTPEPSNDRPTRRQTARARELTIHAAALAALLWSAVALDLVSPGPLGRFSQFPKGNDFVQFYVAGSLAARGAFAALADPGLFADAQRPMLPDAGLAFPPVYGPQLALFFAPLSRVPYLWAYALWAGLTSVLVAWTVVVCRNRAPSLGRWPVATAAIAAAYPPFPYLILVGQISAVGVASLALGAIALERRSRLGAGAAIGLLGYKASLLVPAVAVCLLGGEPLVAAIAIATAVALLVAVVPLAGAASVHAFVVNTLAYARQPDLLAKNRYLMASLRTFWEMLLPHHAAIAAYALSGAAVVGAAALVWRRTSNPLRRIGVLGLATVLAAPHLYFYDLILLVPAFVASAAILVQARALALRWCTYLAFVAPLAAPIAAYTSVQPVTIVLCAWLAVLARTVGSGAEPAAPDDPRSAR